MALHSRAQRHWATPGGWDCGSGTRIDRRGAELVLFDPLNFGFVARSSSGPGHRPLKAEITGSNPVRATKSPVIIERYGKPAYLRGFLI